MPTAAWNTRWAKGLRRFKRGDHEALLAGRGFEIVEHDRALLDHSNVVVIRKPAA